MYQNCVIATLLGALISVAATSAQGQNVRSVIRGSSGPIIATGVQREYLRSLPIEQRPNRPLHFYGNTVRRLSQRGK